MSTALASLSNRLTTAQSQLLERSRVLSLGLVPSPAATTSLVRTLTQCRNDLAKLAEAAAIVGTGLGVGGKNAAAAGGADAEAVEEVGQRYDRLVAMLQADDDGRERAKGLVREVRVPSPAAQSVASEASDPLRARPSVESYERDPPLVAPQPIRPFRDYDDDEEEGNAGFDHSAVLSQQQEMMNDQDERLNLLSHSIGRQNHLSVQIGDELDIHHELLEDTEAGMDRTAARLNRARRSLDTVADNAKQHGSTITIVGLIVVLLLLIIVFKT